jgi:hypothetical protein
MALEAGPYSDLPSAREEQLARKPKIGADSVRRVAMLRGLPQKRSEIMPAPPVLPPSWLQVLEKIEDALTETVRQTAEREQALAAAPADVAEREAAWQKALTRLDDRLAALDDCVERANRAATAADAALADGAGGAVS